MIWSDTFEKRLQSWNHLRVHAVDLPLHECLQLINSWWLVAPWTAYYLHWDDRDTWPTPWQLLEDNVYCSVARSLGIMYTVGLMARPDTQDAVMFDNGNDSLILIAKGKYILNWDKDCIVNSCSHQIKQRRIVTLCDLQQKIR